jgi:Winged helix DNA-binding domain
MRDEWLARQFPSGELSVPEVLRRTGWIHTAGGTGPYLSLKARIAAVTRQQIDHLAYRTFEILEVPTVRESTMLVPREDAAIALAAGRRAMMARWTKLPIDAEEIDVLAERIVKTLGDGTRSADQLRNETPPKLITDLGEAGKKLGLTSTLSIALRLLQSQGRIVRLGENLRLDAKRYLYRRWPDSLPLGKAPDDLDRALAERFLTWAAPATADDFAFWAGIGKTAAKKALGGAPPVPSPKGGKQDVMLLPFRDNYFLLHRGLTEFATGVKLLDMSNKPAPIERLESLHHNAIVADAELRGIWEYDPHREKIVWQTFRKTRGVERAVAETEEFIRRELGDHKIYAFDHGRTRDLRLAFIEE